MKHEDFRPYRRRKPRPLAEERAFVADIAARGGDLELAAEIMRGDHDDLLGQP